MSQNNIVPCPQRLRVRQHLQLPPQLGIAVPGASRAESPHSVEPRRTRQ